MSRNAKRKQETTLVFAIDFTHACYIGASRDFNADTNNAAASVTFINQFLGLCGLFCLVCEICSLCRDLQRVLQTKFLTYTNGNFEAVIYQFPLTDWSEYHRLATSHPVLFFFMLKSHRNLLIIVSAPSWRNICVKKLSDKSQDQLLNNNPCLS